MNVVAKVNANVNVDDVMISRSICTMFYATAHLAP